MKKIIRLTESQLSRVIKRIVEEVEGSESQSSFKCQTKDFKDIGIQEDGIFSGPKIMVLKSMIKDSKTRFQVTGIIGTPLLNKKPVEDGMIITPNTTITVCSSDHILISGMGYPEAEIIWGDNGIPLFNKQHA